MEAQKLLEEKKALRRKMKELRKTVSDRKNKDSCMLSYLLQIPQVQEADTIYVYASYGTEAGTFDLIQTCLAMGKQVALPRVSGREMDFYQIGCLDDLQPGAYGIPEPAEDCLKMIPGRHAFERGGGHCKNDDEKEFSCRECMILPGLAFDLSGHRLGYGGGYYDRYLEKYPFHRENRIALAYECQITEQVPSEPADIAVGMIVTEKGLIVTACC